MCLYLKSVKQDQILGSLILDVHKSESDLQLKSVVTAPVLVTGIISGVRDVIVLSRLVDEVS